MIDSGYSARELMPRIGRTNWPAIRRHIYRVDDILFHAGAPVEEHIQRRGNDFDLSPFAVWLLLDMQYGGSKPGLFSKVHHEARRDSLEDREKYPVCVFDDCYKPATVWRDVNGDAAHCFSFCPEHKNNAVNLLGNEYGAGYNRKAVCAA